MDEQAITRALGFCASFAMVLATLTGCENSPALEPDTGSAIALTEELRVGGLDGEEEYTFAYVATIAPAPDGSVYVGDGQIPIVRKYDASGVHIMDVGGAGQGPGEYQSVEGLGVRSDGVLVLWDSRSQRFTYYRPDGSLEATRQIQLGVGGWRGFLLSDEGDALMSVAPETGFAETREGMIFDWARIDADGVFQRLYTSPSEDPSGPRYVLAGRGGYYRAFVTATLSALGPDGSLYTVRNDEYKITRTWPDGHQTVIERAEPRVEVTDEETAEWEARSESFAERVPEQRSEFFPIPGVKPYIRELVVDADGRLWVSRYTQAVFNEYSPAERAEREAQDLPSYEWRDEPRWDVFGPDDRFLGYVVLPFNTSFVTAAGNVVWGVQAGDFREDYVVRWRVGGGEPGSVEAGWPSRTSER